METGEQVIQETAQQQEEIDPKTKVVTARLDSVNVSKARRPACHPKSVKKNVSVTQKHEKNLLMIRNPQANLKNRRENPAAKLRKTVVIKTRWSRR